MKILAVGCSITAGEELPDIEALREKTEHPFFLTSKLAYPSLVAKIYNADITNLSMHGGSNGRIFRKVMSESVKNHYDLIICGWTLYQRVDFQHNGVDYPFNIQDSNIIKRFPWLLEFIANHYSSRNMIESWLASIVALQNHFKYKNQRYLFLGVDVLNQEETLLFPELVNEVDPAYYLGWPDEYLGGANTPKDNIGPYGHPLEKGHQVIADKIVDRIKELKWFESQIQE
jgi:hypothetical protein